LLESCLEEGGRRIKRVDRVKNSSYMPPNKRRTREIGLTRRQASKKLRDLGTWVERRPTGARKTSIAGHSVLKGEYPISIPRRSQGESLGKIGESEETSRTHATLGGGRYSGSATTHKKKRLYGKKQRARGKTLVEKWGSLVSDRTMGWEGKLGR